MLSLINLSEIASLFFLLEKYAPSRNAADFFADVAQNDSL